MLDFLNENAGAIQAISTVILVVITAWYAVTTHKLAVATREQVDAYRRSEQLNRSEAIIRVSQIARDLLQDVDKVARRAIPELVTKMQSPAWQDLRDDLELSAIEIVGVIQRHAEVAAEALREWDLYVRMHTSQADREMWEKAEEQLDIAKKALQMIVDFGDTRL
jgi:hypothetical protein